MRPVELIGLPLDLGAGRRGVDMGANALRIAGLAGALVRIGYQVTDQGNIDVPQPETRASGDTRLRYLHEISEACRRLCSAVERALDADRLPLILGGDHSLAMGSIAAVSRHAQAHGHRLGVLWLDAHGDMNSPETTPSGNIHGMPLAVLLGNGHPDLVDIGGPGPSLSPNQVALVGVRDLDAPEAQIIRNSGVHVWTMRAVDEHSMKGVMERVLATLEEEGIDWLHVSFDVDFLDPGIAPGVGTRVRGGPSYREAHLGMEMLSDSGLVRSVDITELNPILDHENRSGELCVELISSLFGKRIL